MDWKLRKDKRKTASPELDAPAENSAPDAATPTSEEETTPVFDLSGNAFRQTGAGEEDQPEPTFAADANATSSDDDAEYAEREPIALGMEPIALGSDPIALEPLPSSESSDFAEPVFQDDAQPRFAPDLAETPSEPIALAPTSSEDAEKPSQTEPSSFDVTPERERVASGLVSTESANGIPKVAPFIVDVDSERKPPEATGVTGVVVRLGNLSATYELTKEVTTIGRPDSVIQNYPDIEIELDDGVSRRHAEIRRQGEGYVVIDVGSTNGSFLNGEKLPPNEPAPLFAGDRMRIGERTELVFE